MSSLSLWFGPWAFLLPLFPVVTQLLLWRPSCLSYKLTTSSVLFRAFPPAVPLVNFLLPSWRSGFCSGVTPLPCLPRRTRAVLSRLLAPPSRARVQTGTVGSLPALLHSLYISSLYNMLCPRYLCVVVRPSHQTGSATRQTPLICSLLVL